MAEGDTRRAPWRLQFVLGLLICAGLAGGCNRDDAGSTLESGRESVRVLLGGTGAAPEAVARQIQLAMSTGGRPPYIAKDAPGDLLWNVMQRFYRRRNFRPVWVSDERGLRSARRLVRSIESANNGRVEGAGPDGRSLQERVDRVTGARPGTSSEREAADLDLHLSYTYLAHRAQAIEAGVPRAPSSSTSNTGESDSLLEMSLREESVDAALPQDAGPLGARLEGAPSAGPEGLRKAVASYERIAAHGGWPVLPADVRLRRGESGPAVTVLKRRLARTGDLPRSFLERVFRRGSGDLFDAGTETAVRRFQERHGLEPNGILGAETVVALDVPAAVRVRQLRANLARAQMLPQLATGRVVVVNIPEYHLRAYDGGRQVLEMRVVIGTEFTPTPAFSDRMTYVVFRPYWNIPTSIALAEIVPAIQRDPRVLQRESLEVVVVATGDSARVVDSKTVRWSRFATSGYSLRRRPGPGNPLGDVKFMFPNRYDVYLHDTPQDNLFRQSDRTLSHGCVRVEKPLDLAEFVLLGKPGWDRERVRGAMKSGETQSVSLPESIPVHIVYWTAWVDADGRVQFRDDIYGLDETARGNSPAIPPASQVEHYGQRSHS